MTLSRHLTDPELWDEVGKRDRPRRRRVGFDRERLGRPEVEQPRLRDPRRPRARSLHPNVCDVLGVRGKLQGDRSRRRRLVDRLRGGIDDLVAREDFHSQRESAARHCGGGDATGNAGANATRANATRANATRANATRAYSARAHVADGAVPTGDRLDLTRLRDLEFDGELERPRRGRRFRLRFHGIAFGAGPEKEDAREQRHRQTVDPADPLEAEESVAGEESDPALEECFDSGEPTSTDRASRSVRTGYTLTGAGLGEHLSSSSSTLAGSGGIPGHRLRRALWRR